MSLCNQAITYQANKLSGVKFMFNQLSPQIYVSCLSAYTAGYLYGAWIDANQSAEAILQEIQSMLSKSPVKDAEEWAIHDTEDFGDALISEYQSIESISELAAFISEHGQLGAALIAHTSNNLEEAQKLLEDGYHGEHDSKEDFVYDLYQSCYEIPDHLVNYIDYPAIARDLFICDYFAVDVSHKKHVFRSF